MMTPLHYVTHGIRAKETGFRVYLFNCSVESCVQVCPAHVVLKCQLSTTVLCEVKPVQSKPETTPSETTQNNTEPPCLYYRALPSEDFKGVSGSRRDGAFRRRRLRWPVASSEDSDCEVHTTERCLKEMNETFITYTFSFGFMLKPC